MKSILISCDPEADWTVEIANTFRVSHLEDGFHYLLLFLKPNGYKNKDWDWLLLKLGKWLTHSHSWISLGGNLILIKSI